jgi:hypothetical protein
LLAFVPVTIVPDPGVQPCGTCPTAVLALGAPRWKGITFPVAALAMPVPLPVVALTIP